MRFWVWNINDSFTTRFIHISYPSKLCGENVDIKIYDDSSNLLGKENNAKESLLTKKWKTQADIFLTVGIKYYASSRICLKPSFSRYARTWSSNLSAIFWTGSSTISIISLVS